MFHRLICAAGLVGILAMGPVQAGEIADAATKAEGLLEAGQFDQAYQAMEGARDLIWRQTPLTFRKTLFVASDPAGFGIYDVRDSSTYKRTDAIVIYTEPAGFNYGRDGEMYVIDMALDLEVKDLAGQSIGTKNDFSSWTLRSRVANKEFMGKLTYDFAGLPAGDYEVITTVRDKNSDKKAAFSLKLTLTE
jgi:hypothetical protein